VTRQSSGATAVRRLTVLLDSAASSLADGLTHRLVKEGERVLTFHLSSARPDLIALLQAFRTFEETGYGIYGVRPENIEYAFSLADRLQPSVVMLVTSPGERFSSGQGRSACSSTARTGTRLP